MRNRPTVSLRRTAVTLTAVVVGLVGTGVLASPAHALPEQYKHEYYGEPHRWELSNENYAGDTFSDGSALNDQVTSVINWTPYYTCYYIDANYGGPSHLQVVPWNGQVHVGSTYNDKISSHTQC